METAKRRSMQDFDIPRQTRVEVSGVDRHLVAIPDTLDFRDKMYVPTLTRVSREVSLDMHLTMYPESTGDELVLDQGKSSACTGYALAAVANFLLRSTIGFNADLVSPRMLYEMAKRYDEWPGTDYEGSSARGAMMGWHKHGACGVVVWPEDSDDSQLNDERTQNARQRPLGAYFRVNHKDVIAMHCAVTEVGILYASAITHAGWLGPGADGRIEYSSDSVPLGGHAFAIVGYDEEGFWIQNSWGRRWGKQGFAHLSYDDWLANGMDVWVARLGVPLILKEKQSVALSHGFSSARDQVSSVELRPHVVSLGNDGRLWPYGTYGTTDDDLLRIAENASNWIKSKTKKRLVIYVHGALTSADAAVQRVGDYREKLMERGIFPLAILWRSDLMNTLRSLLQDALRSKTTEGILDSAKDFMFDRIDDALEPAARALGGKAIWDELKENAVAATAATDGGARKMLEALFKHLPMDTEIHLIGYSAGSIFLGPLIQQLTSQGRGITTCNLWAPACTMKWFEQYYVPALRQDQIDRFSLFTLTDQMEQDDDCANIYHKSILYLVANGLEEQARIFPLKSSEPILGMEKHFTAWISRSVDYQAWGSTDKFRWIRSPNDRQIGTQEGARAKRHVDFDQDFAILRATLARILDVPEVTDYQPISSTESMHRELRVRTVSDLISPQLHTSYRP